MEKNVSSQEAAVRIVFGAILLAFSVFSMFFAWMTQHYALTLLAVGLLIGGGLLSTGILRTCPFNKALKNLRSD